MEKIKKESIPDQVYQILKKEIIDGALKVGDKLPSENELSSTLGVGRSSIKIAVQRLCMLGLVETKPGDGSYVREFNYNEYLNHMFEFILSEQDIASIAEYRLNMEMACCKLAMDKATEQNYCKMEELLKKMDEAVQENNVALHAQLDYAFHLEICKATQNDIFVHTYQIIGNMLIQYTKIKNEMYLKSIQGRRDVEDIHWVLYHAIQNRDVECCMECYNKMFFF